MTPDVLLIGHCLTMIRDRDLHMKDRDDIRDDLDDRDHIRENGTNGIDHKSLYSLAIRTAETNNPC